MQTSLECIESFNQQNVPPVAVVIWLHGLGADNRDFLQLVPEMPLQHSLKFIFPNAPMRAITLNGGYVMRGWYDIRELGNLSHMTDAEGISQSVVQIEDLIKQQIDAGFRSEQVILAGFSQGGVISYVTGINGKYKLGGVLALSCYLPSMPLNFATSLNKATAFFAVHGTQDQVVPYRGGVQAYEQLKNEGFNIQWAEYPMPHSVCLEEIAAIGEWLDSVVSS